MPSFKLDLSDKYWFANYACQGLMGRSKKKLNIRRYVILFGVRLTIQYPVTRIGA